MFSVRDTVDATAKSMATLVVLRHFSWLRTAGLAKDAQARIEYLPFDRAGLFNAEIDDILEIAQKKLSTAKQWGVYPSYHQCPQRNHWRQPYNSYQRFQQEPQRQQPYTPYFKQQYKTKPHQQPITRHNDRKPKHNI